MSGWPDCFTLQVAWISGGIGGLSFLIGAALYYNETVQFWARATEFPFIPFLFIGSIAFMIAAIAVYEHSRKQC